MTEQQRAETNNIRLLPEHLIDQIKAGEVIERPASLLKELVENSLDAHSKKIDIHIRENGLELISIEDDGDGIEYPDLPYAFCRHATSKIERFEDLYALNSFGFRGEALASISSTSRLTCVSTPKHDRGKGGKIIIHGGEQKSLTPHKATNQGTSIFVKDLFFNTPARLKFIKSKVSEKNALKRTLHSFLLSNPQTTFSIKWDDKEKEFYPTQQLSERLSQILFKKNADNKDMIEFEKEYEGHHVRGFISKSSSRGNAGKNHYLFANKRLFNERQLHMGIVKSMERYWAPGEVGHYCVIIDVPASQIDVNVHPNKTQVKFFKSSMLFSLISSAVKESIIKEMESRHQLPEASSNKDNSFNNPSPIEKFTHNPFQNNNTVATQEEAPDQAHRKWSHFSLSPNFSLIKEKNKSHNKTYLVDISKLISTYIWSNLKQLNDIQEAQTTPLLISEPFSFPKGPLDQLLSPLKARGFELDRLDEQVLVLRSIPTYLSTLPVQGIMQLLLIQLEKNYQAKMSIDDLFDKVLNNSNYNLNFFLSFSQIEQLQERFNLDELIEKQIILELTEQKLKSFIKNP